MTRKHFRAIAQSIAMSLEVARRTGGPAAEQAVKNTAAGLATTLAGFNANFDRQRFMTACGF